MSEQSFDEPISDELAKFEKAIADLRPAASRVDRDRLMFEAGRASGGGNGPASLAIKPWHTGSALWPTTTVVMTGLAAVLTVLLLIQHSTPNVKPMAASELVPSPSSGTEHPPLQAASASERISPALNEASYMVLRRRFTGLDGSSASLTISGASTPSRESWGNLFEMRRRFLADLDSLGDVPLSDSGEQS